MVITYYKIPDSLKNLTAGNITKFCGESAEARQENYAGKMQLLSNEYKYLGSVYFKVKYGTCRYIHKQELQVKKKFPIRYVPIED